MTGGRWGVTAPQDSAVISLTYDRWWWVEVRGFARISGMSDMLWQSAGVELVRLLSAVTAIRCVSWNRNQPSGLLTGEAPCRSMLR